ncbi:MAG: methyltransferase domain-containing protein [Chitinophagaceae bacterium]
MNLTQRVKATINFKFSFLKRSFGSESFRLLDVGAGNHSASRIHAIFPACEYYGLDMDTTYNNNEEDFSVMKDFYELDLTKLDYSIIPDHFFDGICMAHVIEHLHNGDEVVNKLLEKLKRGGYFYIEYPGIKSTKLPSMHGSLNFYDDASHVRIYSVRELAKVFEENNCTVLKSGIRRNLFYIIGMPVKIITSILTRKKLQGNIFWDLLGFAEFLYVRKNK